MSADLLTLLREMRDDTPEHVRNVLLPQAIAAAGQLTRERDGANAMLDWIESQKTHVRGTDYPMWLIEGIEGDTLRTAIAAMRDERPKEDEA